MSILEANDVDKAAVCSHAALPSEALVRFGCDKGQIGQIGHNYASLYDLLFVRRQCYVRSVLEVGVGSVSRNAPNNMVAFQEECNTYVEKYGQKGCQFCGGIACS